MNHWQTIENALLDWKESCYDVDERAAIDAALAFVREMRQGQWIRKPLRVIEQPPFEIDLEDDAPPASG